jgi:creatinine amidohydrolase
MLIEEMTMPGFERGLRRTQTVLIPVGSLEEHGAHLPLATDTLEAYELTRRVGEVLDVFVSPPIPFGVLRSTRDHPGSVSISPVTLRAVILDLVRSFYHQGLRRFVVLSGHAGSIHMAALREAGEALVDETDGIAIAVLSLLDLIAEGVSRWIETRNDSHAGEVETSIMLFLRPHLVRGTSKAEFPSFPEPILVRDRRRYWPGGVWGDPSKADREKGRMLVESAVSKMCDLVRRLEAFPQEPEKSGRSKGRRVGRPVRKRGMENP